jgi:hypothetical protein
MGRVVVPPHTRVNPKTGKLEQVDGYTYTRKGKGARTATFVPARRAEMTPFSQGSNTPDEDKAQQERKRMSLLPDGVPTKETAGWQMRTNWKKQLVLSMTDEKYDSWLQNTIKVARAAHDKQGPTSKRYGITLDGGDHYLYTKARQAQQEKVLRVFQDKAAKVPKDRKVVFTGGKPGAGKSSSLGNHNVNDERFFTIDSDQVKAEMIRQGLAPDIPGLTPFEASGLIHQESNDIANKLTARLVAERTNIVIDGTMAWRPHIIDNIELLQALGYSMKGLFVEVTPETSKRRAMQRHRSGIEDYLARGDGLGGRFVDPSISMAEPERNRKTFDSVKDLFEDWAVYDNNEDGRDPVLIDSKNGAPVEFSHRSDTLGDVDTVEYYLRFFDGR